MVARMPGVTTGELLSRIGRSSPRSSLVYKHATAERDQAMARDLDKEIESAKPAVANEAGATVMPMRRS